MISRRNFMALASGLLVPEPQRVYSFAGGWALPRWQPILYLGAPVFHHGSPLAIWDKAPGELLGWLSTPGMRVGTYAELDRFNLLRREHHNVTELYYSDQLSGGEYA